MPPEERTTSVQDEIQKADFGRPHLVILGAGASVAALPNGDKYGRRLPVMANLIETLDLVELLSPYVAEPSKANFEQVYSELFEAGKRDVTQEIEKKVFSYFSSLRLPDAPTIYDHLILSLRPKDAIATFNWDPFLWQACARNRHLVKNPHLLFLHGNAGFGVCRDSRTLGPLGATCGKSGKQYERVPLLFPVTRKDYNTDDVIKTAWDLVTMCLGHAYMLTIFGYGAPETDVEAVRLMREAWGSPFQRNLEQIEIIDIEDEGTLSKKWKDFIHTHHYQVSHDFYDSWIANHPRRSCEAMWNQTMEVQFLDRNPIPKDLSFPELWDWYAKFLSYEDDKGKTETTGDEK